MYSIINSASISSQIFFNSLFMNGLPKKPVMVSMSVLASTTALYVLKPETAFTKASTVIGYSIVAYLITEGMSKAASKVQEKIMNYLSVNAFKNRDKLTIDEQETVSYLLDELIQNPAHQ